MKLCDEAYNGLSVRAGVSGCRRPQFGRGSRRGILCGMRHQSGDLSVVGRTGGRGSQRPLAGRDTGALSSAAVTGAEIQPSGLPFQ